jgi:hypothetical protein
VTERADSSVPEPPDANELDPLIHEWGPERLIFRSHDSSFGATEFNRTDSEGRFRPVRIRGRIAGTLYGASDDAGAIAEHVFRPVPVDASVKRVRRARLVPVMISTLACNRTLRLASLHGHGSRRLGVSRRVLVESDTSEYERLAAWGQALHDCPAQPDGLIWRSRHYDDSYVFALYEDRVARRELKIVGPPLPLAAGRGLERVMELAEQAGITIVE